MGRAGDALVDCREVLSVVELFCSVDVRHSIHEVDLADLVEAGGSCFDSDCLSANMAPLVIKHWGYIRRNSVDVS